jgi:Ca2+:H+ antiporter
MSELLVGAAAGTGKALGMSDVFIGIVFLAVIGGAAESVRRSRWRGATSWT